MSVLETHQAKGMLLREKCTHTETDGEGGLESECRRCDKKLKLVL
jgi:hypothetical protein